MVSREESIRPSGKRNIKGGVPMAKKKMGIGLLPKLLLGVFIPILIVFFIIGTMVSSAGTSAHFV